MGAVGTLNEALTEGKKLAKQSGETFVWEKAKCKDDRGKRVVCYRGFLWRERKIPEVITIEEWRRTRHQYED
jgi:hypothetical protein